MGMTDEFDLEHTGSGEEREPPTPPQIANDIKIREDLATASTPQTCGR